MAGLFSTATLGLQLNTAAFNSQLQSVGRSASAVFNGMTLGANQFKAAWDDATRGIKDTKRIISGILISQGFYALMNGLADAGAAALTFSMNMETAAVSMEYFMEGSDKAAKSLAYLREMNEFAARTPFSTEAALELSKYVQAVGIGTRYTKSFLQVVTDAAAATGATTENLQRVVFALGQMKTKGRIANEEIRQLANANIPIYEILQEELGLTGDQISNIGKYWVDADKAIVAILDGLDKRYKGAADRISNTISGMLDTIKDDALIISQEAGSEIYGELSDLLTKVRDKLDEYRDVATETGGFGLFNHILLDIDPTGEVGTDILVLVGNVQQLISALGDLYVASRPIIGMFTKGLYAGINTATVVMTSFSRVLEDVEKGLDKLGITSGDLGASLAELYIMYRAGKWALTLGQGATYAALSLLNTGKAVVTGLVPALNAGTVSAGALTANLLGLAAAGFAIYSLLNNMNNFAGLDMEIGDVFPTDYEQAMNDYLAAMEDYNAQIEKYQAQFNTPYDEMTDGSASAIEGLEDTAAASKKAAKSVKHDWVAAFDEVYQVPTFNDAASGAGNAPKLPDLGELLSKAKFKFPAISVDLKKPELEDFFDNGILDRDVLDTGWWKGMLPALITMGVLGAATHFRKPGYDIDAGKGPKDASVKPADVRKAAAKVVDEIDSLKKTAVVQADELAKQLGDNTKLNTPLDGASKTYAALQETMKKIDAKMAQRNALAGDTLKAMPETTDLKQLKARAFMLESQFRAMRMAELQYLISNGKLQGAKLEEAKRELKALSKKVSPVDRALNGATNVSIEDLRKLMDNAAARLYDNIAKLNAANLASPLVTREQAALLRTISEDMQLLLDTGDRLVAMGALNAGSGYTQAQRLYSLLDANRKAIGEVANKGTAIVNKLAEANATADTVAKEQRSALVSNQKMYMEQANKTQETMLGLRQQMSNMSDAAIAERKQERLDREKREAELAAKQQAELQARETRLIAENDARRAAAIDAERSGAYALNNEDLARQAAHIEGILGDIDDDTAAIKELTGYMSQSRTVQLDFIEGNLDQLRLNAGSNLTGAAYDAAQDELIMDTLKRIEALGASTDTAELPDRIKQAITAALDAGGINEENVTAFTRAIIRHADNNADVLQLFNRSLRNILPSGFYSGKHAAGLTDDQIKMLLDERFASRASFGIGSFEGSLADIFGKAFGDRYPELADALVRSANASVETAAAMGRYTQSLGLVASRMKWGQNGANLMAGGYIQMGAGTGSVDGLLQLDAELRLIRNATEVSLPATITSMSQRNIDAMVDNAKWITNANDTAIRVVSADMLKAVNPELYAQIGYQLSQQSGRSGAISILNRDFELTDIHKPALDRFRQAFSDTIHMAPASNKPFAVENVDRFASYFPSLDGADAMTKLDAYMRRILMPTLNIPEYVMNDIEQAIIDGVDKAQIGERIAKLSADIDFAMLNDAYETFVVDFTDAQVKALNAAGNAKAIKKLNSMMMHVAGNQGLAGMLGSYIKFNENLEYLGGQVARINASGRWRQISRLSDNTTKFVNNILKTSDALDGYIAKPFKNAVDAAIAEFQFDIARATSPDDIKRITGLFQKRLQDFSSELRSFVKDSSEGLLLGSTMTHDSMLKVARALDMLAEHPLEVDKLPMLVRSIVDTTTRLNAMIDADALVTAEAAKTVRQLANDSEMLLNALGSTTDAGARQYFEALTRLHANVQRAFETNNAILAGTVDGMELQTFGKFANRIDPLITSLGAEDSLRYYAELIYSALGDGTLAVTDGTMEEVLSKIGLIGMNKPATDIHALPRPVPEAPKHIIDTETTGLFSYAGKTTTFAPDVLQVARLNVETGEVDTFYVTRGGPFDAKALDIIKNIPGVGEAWKDVTFEAFQAGAVPEKQVKQLLESLLGNAPVTGYNAVNFNRLGGGYDFNAILKNFGFELASTTDVMSKAADVFERTTGARSTFKLSELAEIIAGAKPTGAHEAGADVRMTQFVAKNIDNGRLEQIIKLAQRNGIRGGLFNSLVDAAQQLNDTGHLPDNLLGSSNARIDFDIPGLSTNAPNVTDVTDGQKVIDATIEAERTAQEAAEAQRRAAEAAAEAEKAAREAEEAFEAAKRFDVVDDAGKLAGDAADAAKAAGGSDSVYSLLKQFFNAQRGKIDWNAFKDNLKTHIEKVTNPVSDWVSNARNKGATMSIDDAYRALFDASDKLGMPELRANAITAQRAYSTGDIDYDSYIKAQNAYTDGLKEYEKVSKQFFKTVTEQLGGAIKGFEAPTDFVHTINAISDSGDDFVAMLIDPKTGIPSLVSSGLHTSGEGILEAAEHFAVEQLKNSDLIAKDVTISYNKIVEAFRSMRRGVPAEEAVKLIGDMDATTKKVFDAFLEIEKVARQGGSVDELGDIAKHLYNAMNDFGSRVVITNASAAAATVNELGETVGRLEDIRWAGNAAADGINAAGDTVSGAFKSVGSRLINGVANFGILDIAAATLQGALQHAQDKQYSDMFQNNLAAVDSSANLLQLNGYDIGKQLGDEVFHGALQEFSFGIANGVASSLTITAVTPLVTAAINAKLGAAIGSAGGPIGTAIGVGVGIAAGLVTDSIIGAMGGHTATNLYLDDYIKALNDGSLVTTTNLEEMCEAMGIATERIDELGGGVEGMTAALAEVGIDVAAIEDRARAQSTAITMGKADYSNWLERDDINAVLYGKDDGVKRDITLAGNSADAAMRVILAMGLGGLSPDMFGSTSLTSDGRYSSASEVLTVEDPGLLEAFEQIKNGTLKVSDVPALAELQRLLGVNIELREIATRPGKVGLYNADTGIAINADLDNLDALEEVFRLMYQQGNTTSSFAEEMSKLLDSNEALREAVETQLGGSGAVAAVYNNMEQFRELFNQAAGTNYSALDISENYQLGEQFMTWATSVLEDSANQNRAFLSLLGSNDKMTTNMMEGDAERVFWGGTLDGVFPETLAALNELGLSFKQQSATINNELTPAYEQSYVTLSTDVDKLFDNLAGWRVDATTFEGLDFTNLTITAQDAEILAQAGIQINSDGTIDFMKADNEGKTGTTRDFGLGAASVSQAIVDALAENSFTMNFEAGEFNFDPAKVGENMYGAMFALPADFESKASPEIKAALEKVGDLMDSGYFMITDKALLNGDKTITAYLQGLLGESHVSGDIAEIFGNIDALIQMEGNDAVSNIIEWANGVVLPSPIPKDWLTPEIEAEFAAAGVSFVEYGNQFLMVMNETGQHIKDGCTMLDTDMWNQLPESLRKALEEMGVVTQEVGNQTMVDLTGVVDKGVVDVVDLFINQPDVWEQIPEAMRQYLSTTVLATEDGFLQIKAAGHDHLLQIGDTWVADWTALSNDSLAVMGTTNERTKRSLGDLKTEFENGMIAVKGTITEAQIPQLTDNQIAVPFDELPEEIKQSLTGPGGLSGELSGAMVVLEGVASTGFNDIVAAAVGGKNGVVSETEQMIKSITDAVTQAQTKLAQLRQLETQMGKSGGVFNTGFLGEDNMLNYQGVTVKGTTYYEEYSSKGNTVKYWYVGADGKWKSVTKLPAAAEGTDYGAGTTLVGELGREMAILPDGTVTMLGATGGELVDLPAGTRVLTNEDTEEVLKYTHGLSSVRKLAEGNADLVVEDAAAPERGDDEFHTVFLAFMKAFIAKYGSEVTEEGNDITSTEVEAAHTDDAAHYIAENHAVAIRGFSAALFEFLEAWRNDKAGLEALGNTISTSIVDNSTKVVDAVKAAGDSVTEAVRGIKLSVPSSYSSSNVSKYTAPIGLESLGDVAATDEDGEPYNWIEDVIKAQKMYAAATTDEERKAAHDLAERARATQGFSGGPDGSQFIPTGGKQTAWVQEVFAAQRDYKYATSDAERMLAHARAEAARATQGFSGGSDGSKFIITEAADKVLTSLKPMLNEETQKEVTQLTEQLKPVQESTKKTTEGVTQFSQSLTVQLNELLGKWSTQDLSTKEAIVNAVAAGCSEVASAVGAYVDWSQSTIKSLENQVSALQAAASHEQRSSASVTGSKKPKGSAKGSLVTEDALYRAGELGLNEAIVPLEQPDVMSLVGSTIAEYMPEGEGSTVVLNDQAAMVEAVLAQTDTITVAIRGAVAAITEDQQNHSDHVVLQVEKIIDTVDTNLKKLDALDKLSDLASSINDLGSSVDGIGNLINSTSNAMNSMNEDLTVLKTELDSKTNTEDVEALPAAISAEFGKWWTDSMAAARNMYATSTDDAGRREAHAKAEDLRALLGYSGGPDGSQYIPLGNGRTNGSSEETDFATNETLARLSTALSEQLTTIWNAETTRDKEHSEKMVSQLDRLYTLVREVAGSLDATMQSSASSIIAAVADGSSMVASAVGSYVNWSQSTIKSLENQVASLQMAASMSARSSSSVTGSKGGGSIKNVRGSAKGSLVTKDALYRAGEGGLNEAIVPLEQPAVMSKVGNAIADAMPDGNGSVYDLATPDMPVDTGSIVESLNANTEVIALAIRGAVAAITENAANHTDGLMVNIDAINATVAENLSKLDSLDTLSNAVGSLGSDISGMGSTMNSVSSAVSGVGNAVQNVSATLESLAPLQAQETTVEQLPEQLGATINTTLEGLAAELIERGRSMYAGAGTDEERARAHETAELGRALLGYSGGPDGSEHIPLDETSTAATIELLNSGMSILADYGTIIGGMLEAQNVLSSDLASAALASSTSFHTQDMAQAEADTNKMFQLETAKFDSQFNLTAEQTRSMSAGMLAQTGALITTFNAGMNYLGSTITAGANYVAAQVGSYVRYAENTMASQRQQIAQLESSLAAAWSAAASASKSGGGSGGSSKSSSSSSKGKGSSVLSAAVKNTVSKVVSTIGGKLSGKKGSARGSLVTEDALYRAGEFGLNEAIIPLERPDVLRQVGASIASFMPVEQRTSMGMAAGMTNGGISPYSAPAPQEDPNMMAGAITQRVLESVLPAMYAMQDDTGEDRRPLYVGTLIADERGLQQLERKLYDIRKVEATRR